MRGGGPAWEMEFLLVASPSSGRRTTSVIFSRGTLEWGVLGTIYPIWQGDLFLGLLFPNRDSRSQGMIYNIDNWLRSHIIRSLSPYLVYTMASRRGGVNRYFA